MNNTNYLLQNKGLSYFIIAILPISIMLILGTWYTPNCDTNDCFIFLGVLPPLGLLISIVSALIFRYISKKRVCYE